MKIQVSDYEGINIVVENQFCGNLWEGENLHKIYMIWVYGWVKREKAWDYMVEVETAKFHKY